MPHSKLISPSDLFPHLNDEGWVVVDCRFDLNDSHLGEQAYLRAHIPGAVYAHLERDLSAKPTGSNGRHPLPADDQLAERFSNWGIAPEVQVVAYDDSGGPFAARLWWLLHYMGHRAAAVLNGGLPAWERASLPLRTGQEARKQKQFVPEANLAMRVEAEVILAKLGSSDVLLLDARAPERFRGDQEPIDPVAGHIPGALNRYWGDNLDARGCFRPAAELRQAFEALLQGRDPRKAIAYCGSGVTACHNLLALAHAGLEGARLYPGSWSEWIADDSRPLMTGDAIPPNAG